MFSGDPNWPYQLAHLLLSPLVEVRGTSGSHLKVGDGFDPSATQASNAACIAAEAVELLKLTPALLADVLVGANLGMATDSAPASVLLSRKHSAPICRCTCYAGPASLKLPQPRSPTRASPASSRWSGWADPNTPAEPCRFRPARRSNTT
jgi:hypothetical protein